MSDSVRDSKTGRFIPGHKVLTERGYRGRFISMKHIATDIERLHNEVDAKLEFLRGCHARKHS